MKKVAVIGHPISHSLSPKLHNYWIKQYRIPAEYMAIDVKPEDLCDTIKRMQDEGYVGCNVTIPHKEAMMDIVDVMNDATKKIGAINTIVFENTGIKLATNRVVFENIGITLATNTDVYGFIANINIGKKYKKALVLGAGGASRAVCDGLLEIGCEGILTNRTRGKAESLANDFENIVKVVDWNEKENYLSDIDLLVNTTSLGMEGMPELEIDLSTLNKDALVTDIVYKPLITPLLEQAQERGNPIVDGLGMLLYQAQLSFGIWFGIEPEVNQELRDYILENME